MNPRRTRNSPAHRSEFRVRNSSLPREPRMIPLWWLSTIVGLFLLPAAWISTKTFLNCMTRETVQHGFWASEEFWFFSVGAVMWVIAFFGLPRPLWIYVFGHEFTHALWVWMMGGNVTKFHVSKTGGHIVSDKHNFWIALAPYFFPVYSVLIIAAFGVASVFWNMEPYHRWLYGLIGLTWAFHITFSLWMIPKGQTDISYYGTFFSLVMIYLMNLVVLTILLTMASPRVTWRGLAHEWLENAESFSQWAVHLFRLAQRRWAGS